MDEKLEQMITESKKRVAAMAPAELDTMVRRQIDGVAKAEASWPKPKFEWVDGVKVYASYEDYCND